MGISGNLKTMVLADLLQWLSQGQKTGTLVFEQDDLEKKIFFDQGSIVSSASTSPSEYLGRFLIGHGLITRENVDQALEQQQETHQLFGQILVGMGLLDEEQLNKHLQLKTEETIYEIFSWDEGEFRFLDQELPEDDSVRSMQLDAQWIILEGSRRVDEWSRIREVIPSSMAVPVIIKDLGELEAEEIDRRILGLIDDDRTVEEIAEGAALSAFRVSQTLSDVASQGYLKMVRPRMIEVRVEVPVAEQTPGSQRPTATQPLVQLVAPPPTISYPQQVYLQPPAQQPPAVVQGPPAAGDESVNVGGGRTLQFAAADGTSLASSAPPSAPPQLSAADELLQRAETLTGNGHLDEAIAALRQAATAAGANPTTEQRAKMIEERVHQELQKAGIGLKSVPKLTCDLGDLANLPISPEEGFMLTRVDGRYDIKSILQQCPMPKLDAQLLFWKLHKAGHVALKD